MRKYVSVAWAVIFLCLSSCRTPPSSSRSAPTVDGIKILWQGTYSARSDQQISEPAVPSGWRYRSSDFRPIAEGKTVPAVLGTRFGIGFQVDGAPAGMAIKLTRTIVFPAGGVPSLDQKKVIQSYSGTIDAIVGSPQLTGYILEVPSELKTGLWKFELYYGSRLLAEETFLLVAADKTPNQAR